MDSITTGKLTTGGKSLPFYGNAASANVFLQPVDEHSASLMEKEAETLAGLCGHTDWCIIAVPVQSWNRDLTPWTSDPVFGKEGFGSGAPETLAFLLDSFIPAWSKMHPSDSRRFYLAGYSLAGLFALWSACQTNAFAGIAAVSPSVWYPGWHDYAETHPVHTEQVYLSMGLKEEKTRNKVMSSVGDAIRFEHERLSKSGIRCTLEWNDGNHFVDSDKRTAKGLAWLLKAQSDPQSIMASILDLKDENLLLQLVRYTDAQPEKHWVPAAYFTICLPDGTPIGKCDLRFGHNDKTYIGGNIGYEIDPPYRGNHYAAHACQLLFSLARRKGMDHLFITCDPDNPASARTCELAGGKYVETAVIPEDNEMYAEGKRLVNIFRFIL